MKTIWKFLIPVPLALGLLAMVPQGPDAAQPGQKDDLASTVRFAELQYVDGAGQTKSVAARSLLVVRVLEGLPEGLRLEIHYENGDYSLIDVQGFHLLRAGRDLQDVRLIRCRHDRMAFPRIP